MLLDTLCMFQKSLKSPNNVNFILYKWTEKDFKNQKQLRKKMTKGMRIFGKWVKLIHSTPNKSNYTTIGLFDFLLEINIHIHT